MQKKFLTTEEISEFYGIDEGTIRGLVDAGDLKALPDRGVMKYRREELDGLIKSGKLHPTKELPVMTEDEVDSDPDFPVGAPAQEKVEFMELDESALAVDSPPPSKASSSSDVVVLEPAAGAGSDSDIHLRGSEAAAGVEDATVLTKPSGDSDHVLEEMLQAPKEDSGLTLDAGDSGISLTGDSGISLKPDSGLTVEQAAAAKASRDAVTEPMVDQMKVTPDQERLVLGEDSGIPQLKMGESSGSIPKLVMDDKDDATTVLSTSEDEPPMSFSGKVEAGESVQDLEVIEALDEGGTSSADAIFADDEEVVEASDEVFSEEYAESGEGEEALAAAPGKAKVSEPSWGGLVNVCVIAASVLLALNAWLVFEGLSTMWNGAAPSGAAGSLISMFAGFVQG